MCHATLALPDGESCSANITFTAQSLACGGKPQGCGVLIEPSVDTWTIDYVCPDAGSPDAEPDVQSGGASD
jgi:hypothetical protein